jgi:hypothetical protein
VLGIAGKSRGLVHPRDSWIGPNDALLSGESAARKGGACAVRPDSPAGEIELIRQVNAEFKQQGWSAELYLQLVRNGIDLRLQTSRVPELEERAIETPRWALNQVAEIGAAAAERIAELGVQVVGDLSVLGARPDDGVDTSEPVHITTKEVAVAAAREAIVGVIMASRVLHQPPSVDEASTRDLARTVLGRLRKIARRRVRRRRRRIRRATATRVRGLKRAG